MTTSYLAVDFRAFARPQPHEHLSRVSYRSARCRSAHCQSARCRNARCRNVRCRNVRCRNVPTMLHRPVPRPAIYARTFQSRRPGASRSHPCRRSTRAYPWKSRRPASRRLFSIFGPGARARRAWISGWQRGVDIMARAVNEKQARPGQIVHRTFERKREDSRQPGVGMLELLLSGTCWRRLARAGRSRQDRSVTTRKSLTTLPKRYTDDSSSTDFFMCHSVSLLVFSLTSHDARASKYRSR